MYNKANEDEFDIMLDEFLTNELNKYLAEKEVLCSSNTIDVDYDNNII